MLQIEDFFLNRLENITDGDDLKLKVKKSNKKIDF